MGGLAYFHDSASGGFPDYCHRKYLRPIRRVYLGAYKKGAFLDQYDSVQNGIKTNYVTFKKLLEVLPLIVLRFFHQSCCASPINSGAVSLLSRWQQTGIIYQNNLYQFHSINSPYNMIQVNVSDIGRL